MLVRWADWDVGGYMWYTWKAVYGMEYGMEYGMVNVGCMLNVLNIWNSRRCKSCV